MKKYIGISLLMLITGYVSLAQVQRTPVKQKTDSSAIVTEPGKNKDSRKEMFRELNLSREQKIKMKEINHSMKASKEAIENDTALSETEKKAKLRALKKENIQKIQAILTEEQKIKFRQLKAKNNTEI